MNNENVDYKGRKYQKAIPVDWQKKRYANKQFGKLFVECPVSVEGMVTKPDSTAAIWLTHCDCGNICEVRSISLRNGDTQSCGCLSQSHGELLIEQLLKENNISYIYDEVYFQDLILPSGGIGRYDFILLDENKQPYRLIEYDGKQHYAPIDFFGGQEALDKLKKNDEVKNQYAKQHSLPLVRIPYTVDNITLDILLSDKYLI